MKIKKISLKNGYKRFRHLTIDLEDKQPKIVALIGSNGCGKSSVFDGMLYKLNAQDAIGQFGVKDYTFHSMDSKIDFQASNIDITFDIGNFNDVYNSKSTNKSHKTIFNFRNAYRFNSNLNIQNLQKITDLKDNRIGASTSVDLDDKMTENYQRLYIKLDKYRRDNKITDDQAKEIILGDLNKILKSVLNLEISNEGNIMDGRGSLFFKKEDQTSEFNFNVLSSGEKEVVDLLLDLYLKKDEFCDSIYLIDEPELHLNTSIQKKLLIEIEKIIPDNCQLWIATHSIGFLNALQLELNSKCEIIYFEGDYSKTEVILKPIKKSREKWKEIFKIALDDLTGLISPKNIIYCEGKYEYGENKSEQGFDAKIYNSVFSIEFQDTLFISSGGQTEPDKYSEIALAILNKAFEGVNIYILKDKDIKFKAITNNDDRLEWLKGSSNRRMLQRKEIENYILDFEIINKRHPYFPKDIFDEIIPDIVDGDVKSKSGILKNKICDFYNNNSKSDPISNSIPGQPQFDYTNEIKILNKMNKEEFLLDLSKNISNDTYIYKQLKEAIF